MREIKFRAWNKHHSEPHQRMMRMVTITNLGLVIMPDGDEWPLPLMQFTGLKDKNGKEIYEGDIVKRTLTDGSKRGEVKWGVTGWRAAAEDMHSTYRYEVMGNIYENSELINK